MFINIGEDAVPSQSKSSCSDFNINKFIKHIIKFIMLTTQNAAYYADQAISDEDVLRVTNFFNPATCRRILARYWPEDHPMVISTLATCYYRWAQQLEKSDLDFYCDFAALGYIYERHRDGKSGHTRVEDMLQKISKELQPQLEQKWQQTLRTLFISKLNGTCTE